MNSKDPKNRTNDAKKMEKELRKEGNPFGNTAETRPLSKAIVQEEKKKKTAGKNQ